MIENLILSTLGVCVVLGLAAWVAMILGVADEKQDQ